jgi:hypothetical protein
MWADGGVKDAGRDREFGERERRLMRPMKRSGSSDMDSWMRYAMRWLFSWAEVDEVAGKMPWSALSVSSGVLDWPC